MFDLFTHQSSEVKQLPVQASDSANDSMPNLLAHNHRPVPGWCVPQEHRELPGKNLCCGNGSLVLWRESTYLKLNIWYALVNGKHLQGRKDIVWWWLMSDNYPCICFPKGLRSSNFYSILPHPPPPNHNHFPSNSTSQHPPNIPPSKAPFEDVANLPQQVLLSAATP